MSTRKNLGQGKYEDEYSRNQCSLVIRVDGEEISVPINFGMTAEEIRAIYPYVLPLVSNKIKNPAVQFADKAKNGEFDDLSDEEYESEINRVKNMSRLWYDKYEVSLLDLAIRLAVDLKLRNIEELADLFIVSNPIDDIQKAEITDEEVEEIVEEMGLETETDREFDAGDEQDIPLGIAGGLTVDLYDDDDDYLSAELDALEATLDVDDTFTKMIDSDISEMEKDRYKSKYEKGKISKESGLLSIYDDENESKSIFDEMNEEDGFDADEEDDLDEIPDEEIDSDEIPDDEEDEDDIPDAADDINFADFDEDISEDYDPEDDEDDIPDDEDLEETDESEDNE